MTDVMIGAQSALLGDGSGNEAGRAGIATPSAVKRDGGGDARRLTVAHEQLHFLIVAVVTRASERERKA